MMGIALPPKTGLIIPPHTIKVNSSNPLDDNPS